jgi:hypothetical protein
MITKATDLFENPNTMIWSTGATTNSNQYGKDIAISSDGSFYVTGYLDCQVDTK